MELLVIAVLLVAAIGGYITGIAQTFEGRRRDISGRYTVNTTDTVLVIPLDNNVGRRTAWAYCRAMNGDKEAREKIEEALEDL